MISIHTTFVCKPGNAGKLALLCKEMADLDRKEGRGDSQVLTDMTGQFHRVIMLSTHENLAAFEDDMKKMEESQTPAQKEMMEKFKDMNEMYVSGSREIYKVW